MAKFTFTRLASQPAASQPAASQPETLHACLASPGAASPHDGTKPFCPTLLVRLLFSHHPAPGQLLTHRPTAAPLHPRHHFTLVALPAIDVFGFFSPPP